MMPAIVGTTGTGTVHRGNFSWATVPQITGSSGITTSVSVNASGGRTEIAVQERLGVVAGGVFGGLVGGFGLGTGLGVGLGVGIGALGSAVFSALFPLGIIGAAYLGARAIYKAVVRGRKREMKRIIDRVMEFFENEPSAEDGRKEYIE